MPSLLECKDEWIYDAICDNKFKYDSETNLYKYDNTAKFPNKNYKKTFDPTSLGLSRGDVVHFGNDNYRNNNKMIFDGVKLQHLCTKVDDYGSVPPSFVCGDGPEDYDIGDFEDVVDHNTINWLSKEKLQEIEILEKDDEIWGTVTIQNKKWTIEFEMYQSETSEFQNGWWGSKKFTSKLENNSIIIYGNNTYLITSPKEEDMNNLKIFVTDDNNVNIIHCYFLGWFMYRVTNEIKFDSNYTVSKFPLIWKKVTQHYTAEALIENQDRYDFYLKNDGKDLDKIYINEIIGYPIKIELVKSNTNEKLTYIKNYINKLISTYDNINTRHPFNRDGHNLLQMYL